MSEIHKTCAELDDSWIIVHLFVEQHGQVAINNMLIYWAKASFSEEGDAKIKTRGEVVEMMCKK